MAKGKITLVGTVHLDLDGKYRLDTLLDRLSPATVGLEYNKERDNLFGPKKSQQEEMKDLEILIQDSGLLLTPRQKDAFIEASLTLEKAGGFELKSLTEYQSRTGARLEYIDMSLFPNGKEEFAAGYRQVLTVSNKRLLEDPRIARIIATRLDQGPQAYLDGIRKNVDLIYRNGSLMTWMVGLMIRIGYFDYVSRSMGPEAKDTMQQIYNPARDEYMAAQIRQLNEPGKGLVAVMGLAHISGIKNRLKDLKPRMLYLSDYRKA